MRMPAGFAENVRRVDVAPLIDPDGDCAARIALWVRRVRNEIPDDAVVDAADSDTSSVRCVHPLTGLRVGHIEHVVLDGHNFRPAELTPLVQKRSILVEDLHTAVAAIGNEDPAFRVHGDVMRSVELSAPGTRFPPCLDESTVLRVLDDSVIETARSVAVRDEDVAIRRNSQIRRCDQGTGLFARDTWFPQRHHDLSFRTELEDLIALAVPSIRIRGPDEALAIDEQAVSLDEETFAPTLQQSPAGGIELEQRRIGAANNDDVARSVEVNSDDLPS